MEAQKIISEKQRFIKSVKVEPSTLLTADLNKDTVNKLILLRLTGSIRTTFGSGTPVGNVLGAMDSLISNIQVVVNGNRTVKSVRPHMMAMQNLLAQKNDVVRLSSAQAAALPPKAMPTITGPFVFGTTTQFTSVYETLAISFENVLAPIGKESTWLNLKGVSSAVVNINTKAYSSFQGVGNTAPVVYDQSSLYIDIFSVEAQDVPSNTNFSDWKQTTTQRVYKGQQTDQIELEKGNFLQGVMMFCQDGAAGTATTATGKLPTNLLLDEINLKLNGYSDIKTTDFAQLQSENKTRFGINAPLVSNVSRFDGVAYLDLLRDGDISSALDCRAPLVDQVYLNISTRDAADGISYTNEASLTVMQNQIVPVI
jgi:hypothetical protein